MKLLSLVSLLTVVGCTTHAPSEGAQGGSPATETPATNGPITPVAETRGQRGALIGTVATRDQKVSIFGRGNGELRVRVQREDGAIVRDGLSLDELRRVDPALHGIVTNATASGEGSFLDATNTFGRGAADGPEGWQPSSKLLR